MLKNKFSFLALLSIFLALPAFSFEGEGLGGNVGFRKNFLRFSGELKDISFAQPGLNYLIGVNDIVEDGQVVKQATWGWNFSTDILSDEDIMITGLTSEVWKDWSKLRWMAGLRADFVSPVGEDTFLNGATNCVGGVARLRFDANGLPCELGGSFTSSYSGADNLSVSSIYLGLVFGQ